MKKFLALAALSLVLAACGKSPTITAEESGLSSLAAPFSTSTTQEYWNDAAGSATGVFTVGQSTGSPVGANKGGFDAIVFKYDFNGNILWKKQIASLANDVATAVAVDPSGQVYVLGGTDNKVGSTSYGQRDLFVVRYGSDGKTSQRVQFGTREYDEPVDIVLDKNQIAYVLTKSGAEDYAVYKQRSGSSFAFDLLLKSEFDPFNPFNHVRYPQARALAVDDAGSIHVFVVGELCLLPR
jgi:hypothetical protein